MNKSAALCIWIVLLCLNSGHHKVNYIQQSEFYYLSWIIPSKINDIYKQKTGGDFES